MEYRYMKTKRKESGECSRLNCQSLSLIRINSASSEFLNPIPDK